MVLEFSVISNTDCQFGVDKKEKEKISERRSAGGSCSLPPSIYPTHRAHVNKIIVPKDKGWPYRHQASTNTGARETTRVWSQLEPVEAYQPNLAGMPTIIGEN